jgi:uncharacterized membrane protein YsdA (DUF1294 family)
MNLSSEILYGTILGLPAAVLIHLLSGILGFYYSTIFVLNILGFFIFGIDKVQAISANYRIPRTIITAIALCGGPLGILIGIKAFRHKTLMPRFKLEIGFFLAIHIAVFYFIFT